MKLTAIVQTYNHERFIQQAIDSVLAQRVNFPFEILVGEDCSTDGTRSLVMALQRRHPDRIRLFLPERNLGQAGSAIFSELLGLTESEYIAWLDGDDFWTEPDKLQMQVDYLDAHPECALCFHRANNLHGDGSQTPFHEYEPNRSAYSLADIVIENFIPAPTVVHRHPRFQRVPDAFFQMPCDWFTHIFMAQRGAIGFLDGLWAIRRVHPGGWISMRRTSEKLSLNIEWLAIIDRYLEGRFHDRISERVEALRRWQRDALAAEGPAVLKP